MTLVKYREEIKTLFDELCAAKNSAILSVISASKKRNNVLKELKDKLRTQEHTFDSVVRDVAATQLEVNSKKTANVVQKQRDALANSISALREANEKLESELADLTTECEQCQAERDKKVSDMKEKWDAHCQAMHHYKKNLNIYIEINDEDNKIFTVYFFQTDKESDRKYSVKLKEKQDTFEMISMNPHLSQEKELQKRLALTNDVQGFLVVVRKLFKHHRDRRN